MNDDSDEVLNFETLAAIDNKLNAIPQESSLLRTYLKKIDSFIANILSESHKVADGANSHAIVALVNFIQVNC